MKIIKNLAVGVFALIGLVSTPVIADDNEVLIDQEGDKYIGKFSHGKKTGFVFILNLSIV